MDFRNVCSLLCFLPPEKFRSSFFFFFFFFFSCSSLSLPFSLIYFVNVGGSFYLQKEREREKNIALLSENEMYRNGGRLDPSVCLTTHVGRGNLKWMGKKWFILLRHFVETCIDNGTMANTADVTRKQNNGMPRWWRLPSYSYSTVHPSIVVSADLYYMLAVI